MNIVYSDKSEMRYKLEKRDKRERERERESDAYYICSNTSVASVTVHIAWMAANLFSLRASCAHRLVCENMSKLSCNISKLTQAKAYAPAFRRQCKLTQAKAYAVACRCCAELFPKQLKANSDRPGSCSVARMSGTALF